MIIHMFPGQGSQKIGMGEGLFDRYPDLVEQADSQLGYSLRQLCLEDPDGKLALTYYTQPALYAVNALSYLARMDDGAASADYLIGHSLGEYNALHAAGAYDFLTGLKLVQRRGEIMSKAHGGGMAAVLGMSGDEVREALRDSAIDTVDIANYNSPGQIVISGLKADVEAAVPALEAAGAKRVILLNVSGAFHSRYMQDAASEFAAYIGQFSFNPLRVPVIANLTASEYDDDHVADTLVAQIDHSVRWTDTILYLRTKGDAEFEEIGPGKVLTGLLRQIR